jgi:AcrR family transcriptional regulator
MAGSGLRERKKQATRRLIADIATGLFLARGFDNVTVAEVAEAANVSKMTVFNYFPRKEDLFLDRLADQLADLTEVIVHRAPGESVVTAVRRYQHELLDAGHPLSGAIAGTLPFWRVLQASPALVNRMHEQARDIQETLASLLTEETGESTRSRLVAGQLAAAVMTVYEIAVQRMLAGDCVQDVRRDQAGVIDEAFDLLERGIGDFGTRA